MRWSKIALAAMITGLVVVCWGHFWKRHVDYNTYHRVGVQVLGGQIDAVYQPDRGRVGGYHYPWVGALLFSASSSLGKVGGRSVFYLLILAGVLGSVRYCIRTNRPAGPHEEWLLFLTLALSARVLGDVFLSGNLNAILFALALVAFHFRATRPFVAGASLGLATALKLFPGLLFVFFAWERRWRTVFWGAGACAVLILVPPFFHGWEKGFELLEKNFLVLRNADNYGGLGKLTFQSFPAALTRVSPHLGIPLAWVTPVAGLTLLILLAALFVRKPVETSGSDGHSEALRWERFALLCALCPLMTPASWYNLGIFYLPMIVLALRAAMARPSYSSWAPILVFFILAVLPGRSVVGDAWRRTFESWNLPFVGALVLWLSSFGRSVAETPERQSHPGVPG